MVPPPSSDIAPETIFTPLPVSQFPAEGEFPVDPITEFAPLPESHLSSTLPYVEDNPGASVENPQHSNRLGYSEDDDTERARLFKDVHSVMDGIDTQPRSSYSVASVVEAVSRQTLTMEESLNRLSEKVDRLAAVISDCESAVRQTSSELDGIKSDARHLVDKVELLDGKVERLTILTRSLQAPPQITPTTTTPTPLPPGKAVSGSCAHAANTHPARLLLKPIPVLRRNDDELTLGRWSHLPGGQALSTL